MAKSPWVVWTWILLVTFASARAMSEQRVMKVCLDDEGPVLDVAFGFDQRDLKDSYSELTAKYEAGQREWEHIGAAMYRAIIQNEPRALSELRTGIIEPPGSVGLIGAVAYFRGGLGFPLKSITPRCVVDWGKGAMVVFTGRDCHDSRFSWELTLVRSDGRIGLVWDGHEFIQALLRSLHYEGVNGISLEVSPSLYSNRVAVKDPFSDDHAGSHIVGIHVNGHSPVWGATVVDSTNKGLCSYVPGVQPPGAGPLDEGLAAFRDIYEKMCLVPDENIWGDEAIAQYLNGFTSSARAVEERQIRHMTDSVPPTPFRFYRMARSCSVIVDYVIDAGSEARFIFWRSNYPGSDRKERRVTLMLREEGLFRNADSSAVATSSQYFGAQFQREMGWID